MEEDIFPFVASLTDKFNLDERGIRILIADCRVLSFSQPFFSLPYLDFFNRLQAF